MSRLGNKKLHQATNETDSAVISASRPATGPPWLSGLPWLRALTRHVSVLPTIEACAASAAATTTTRLSWLLGFLAVAGHVPRLAAVEAVSASTATAALPRLSAVSGHVTVLATVEAALAATAASAGVATSSALLAPADSNRAATDVVTIEVRDGLLSVLFLVEVDETEASL